jgi:hypothetical protein
MGRVLYCSLYIAKCLLFNFSGVSKLYWFAKNSSMFESAGSLICLKYIRLRYRVSYIDIEYHTSISSIIDRMLVYANDCWTIISMPLCIFIAIMCVCVTCTNNAFSDKMLHMAYCARNSLFYSRSFSNCNGRTIIVAFVVWLLLNTCSLPLYCFPM